MENACEPDRDTNLAIVTPTSPLLPGHTKSQELGAFSVRQSQNYVVCLCVRARMRACVKCAERLTLRIYAACCGAAPGVRVAQRHLSASRGGAIYPRGAASRGSAALCRLCTHTQSPVHCPAFSKNGAAARGPGRVRTAGRAGPGSQKIGYIAHGRGPAGPRPGRGRALPCRRASDRSTRRWCHARPRCRAPPGPGAGRPAARRD